MSAVVPFEVHDPAIVDALLDEVQVEALAKVGIRVARIVLEDGGDPEEAMRVVSELVVSEEYRSLRKRAALGDAVAGIVHQGRNIMTGVLSFAQVARGRNQLELLESLLLVVEEESSRCVDLLNQALILARSGEQAKQESFEPCALDEILEAAYSVVHPSTVERGVVLRNLSCEEVPTVLGSPTALHDVFINLLRNAIDATPPGGSIKVRARKVPEHVEVAFDDSGPGVAKEDRAKVFTPFYTTKGIGRGTGLGLAVSRQVLIEHGGSLVLEQSVLGGARFVVLLPTSREEDRQ